MSKIKVAGNAVVVESALKLEDIKTVKRYNEAALVLMEGEGEYKEPVFAIDVAGNSMGCINSNGAEFGGVTEDGHALITFVVSGAATDIKKWVGENLTGAIMKLNKLEKSVAEALVKITADQKAVMDAITVA